MGKLRGETESSYEAESMGDLKVALINALDELGVSYRRLTDVRVTGRRAIQVEGCVMDWDLYMSVLGKLPPDAAGTPGWELWRQEKPEEKMYSNDPCFYIAG